MGGELELCQVVDEEVELRGQGLYAVLDHAGEGGGGLGVGVSREEDPLHVHHRLLRHARNP